MKTALSILILVTVLLTGMQASAQNFAPSANMYLCEGRVGVSSTVDLRLSVNDANLDPLRISLIGSIPPAILVANISNGVYSVSSNTTGLDTLYYMVCDTDRYSPHVLCDTDKILFVRYPLSDTIFNHSPNTNYDHVTLMAGNSINVDMRSNDQDWDNDSLKFGGLVWAPSVVSVSINPDHTVRVTAPAHLQSRIYIDTIIYYFCDSSTRPPAPMCTTDDIFVTLNGIDSSLNAYAGPDQNICLDTIATMAATGTGTWGANPGNPTVSFINSPTSPTTTITFPSNGIGTYMFIWTPQGGTSDAVLITRGFCAAGPDQTICQNTNATMAASGSGTWSTVISNPAATIISDTTLANTAISGFTQPGTYSFVWTTSSGSDTVSVRVANAPTITLDSLNNVTCYGANNGSIGVSGGGSTGPYSYSWTNGRTGSSMPAIPAGTYCVYVTDSSGCYTQGCFNVTQPTPLVVTGTVINSTCYGSTTGSICVSTSGGSAPYRYHWSNGEQGACDTLLPSGPYCLTVQDNVGCTASYCNTVTQPTQLTITDTVTNATCYGSSTGSICVTVSGGTPAYNFQWSGGLLWAFCQNNLTAGTYSLTVTDANACTARLTDSVRQGVVSNLTFTSSNVSCNGGSDGSISVNQGGGSGGYVYVWGGGSISGQTGNLMNGLSADIYCVTVTDTINGCTVDSCLTITDPAPLLVTDAVHNVSYQGGADGSICLTVTGGTPIYTYTWSPGPFFPQHGGCLDSLVAGDYNVTVVDANGCSAGFGDSVLTGNDCIWPGDADANYLVDNNDLLAIGLGYDSIGPSRSAVSIVWQADFANDWADIFANYTPTVNFKHADCNGDGIIDANDTVAIMQNFGLTHSKTNGSPAPWRSGQPVIYPTLSKDTVTNGDTLLININLGQVILNANNVYGIAFDISYDAAVIDTTKTSMTFGNSWLGDSTDKISIYKDLKSQGVIKAAVTRIDHTTRSGQGQIAYLRAIVTTDNIDGKDLQYYTFRCSISDVTAIDAAGHVINLNEGVDSNQVAYTPTGIPDINELEGQISLYPNPANSFVTIACAKTHIEGADVTNVLGEVVNRYSYTDASAEHVLDLQGLTSGVYYISIKTKAGTVVRKVLINH